MHIDQLAVLLGLVVLANLALLAALVVPGIARRRAGLAVNGALAATRNGTPNDVASAAGGELRLSDLEGEVPIPTQFYERIVRVVSYLFIGAALLVVSLTGTAQQPLTYGLLVLGVFLIVLAQDILPLSLIGRWRYAVEAVVVIVFISALIVLTGGFASPFFVGYLLLLAGTSLWTVGAVPFVLALLTSAAYLIAIAIAPASPAISPDAFGLIAFNLVALALVSYVAAVIGREQRRVRETALRISRLDVLTGLQNRAFAEAALERELLRAGRTNRPFSLLMIDLDDLKAVNDRYGHESGDRLLRAVADAIRNGIRATDVAARYGGDEFVVVLPDTDLAGALRVGEKLRFDISRLALRHNGDVLHSSASLGLVGYPDDGRSSVELMRRVDMAMYEAKRRGRNQLVRFARAEEREEQPPAPVTATDTRAGGRAEQPRSDQPVRPTTIPIERPLDTPGRQPQPPAPWETRNE